MLSGHGLSAMGRLTVVLAAGWIWAATPLRAGGPLLDFPNSAYRWDASRAIRYALDPGPLATSADPGVQTPEGAPLVARAFQAWSDATGGALRFESEALPEDVDASNFERFIGAESPPLPGRAVIVFDADGGILSALFGRGAENFILGAAGARDLDGDGFLDYGEAILNGRRAAGENATLFEATQIHEFGHLLGLDHTQAGSALFDLCQPSDPNACLEIPIMYPMVKSAAPEYPVVPSPDDRAWIDWLYPNPEQTAAKGAIRGAVKRRSGYAFQGANVVAVPVTRDPDGQVVENRAGHVSAVSDFLYGFDGAYLLPGLDPGLYVVFIEPLMGDFSGASAVGPFSRKWTAFPKDYFNDDESGETTDDPTKKTVVKVVAGTTATGIDLVSNDEADTIPGNRLRDLLDDDTRGYLFPPGFEFPFFGRRHRGVFVNSDGSLTFGEGEDFNVRRDENRFLTGPPRVAPLFRDLNPIAGNGVEATISPDGVAFRWNRVPRFNGPAGEVNTFAVTLSSGGDILFDYEDLSIQPDPETGVSAIVGLSPGGSGAGSVLQFSEAAQPVAFPETALYEVLRDPEAALRLPREIRFEGAVFPPRLFFPFYSGDASNFSGFAVANDSTGAAQISVEAFSADGTTLPYPDNPHVENLPAGEQFARVGAELFGLPPATAQDGWVRMSTAAEQLASFFQFGTVNAGALSRLDGSVAITEPASTLHFTRIYSGIQSFPAPNGNPRDSETFFALANPSPDQTVQLSFQYFAPTALPVGPPASRSLPPLGCLRESFSSLFPGAGVVSDGFVRVQAAGPGAVGFELVVLADALLGLNASTGNPQNVSYSAQLAHGVSDGVGIYTSLKLVNVSDSPLFVVLTALDEAGNPLGQVVQFAIQPNQTFQRPVGTTFGLGPASGPAVAGSIRVESSGPGLIGDVVFGDPDGLRYLAALPLQTRLLRRAIFGQVANARGATASATTFTGLAFHNPNPQSAQVTVSVHRENGSLAGRTVLNMAPNTRLSSILEFLVPESAGQVRGYIVVESTRPVVAQQLFGNLTLDFLSAVPPTIFQ